MSDDLQIETALRQGLRDIPHGPISPDFDDAVLLALRQPHPWWRTLWQSTAPMLYSGACSFVAMAVIVLVLTHLPASLPSFPAGAGPSMASGVSANRPVAINVAFDVDKLLDKSDLRLVDLWNASKPPEAVHHPQPTERPRGTGMRPGPERRTELTA